VRSLAAAVVLLVGALMVPVATAGWWVRDTVVPTSSYVRTVAPLATDPVVVAAVDNRLVTETMQAVDQSVPGRVAAPALRARVRTLVRLAVRGVVEDPAFGRAWRASNAVAHDQVVAVLSGDNSSVSVGRDSTVSLELATLATAIRHRLIDAHVPFARALPVVRVSFPIGNVRDVARARRAYGLLDGWGRLLPLTALVLVGLGLLLARGRVRAIGWTAFASLAGMGLLAIAIVVGRTVYLGSLPGGIPKPAAAVVFDTITSGLRHDMVLVSIGALLLLVVTAALGRLATP
jgi:hypothetical protein